MAVDSGHSKAVVAAKISWIFRNVETKLKLSFESKILEELIFISSLGSSAGFPLLCCLSGWENKGLAGQFQFYLNSFCLHSF